jgi:putative methionine-R-sulfoxide reductase with GAF domain
MNAVTDNVKRWLAKHPSFKENVGAGLLVVMQVVLFCVGLWGAYYHAFPLAVHAEHENVPALDLVTIAWLGLSVVAVVFPRVTEVAFGDVTVKLREATKSVDAYRDVSEDLANLVQNWSTSSLLYLTLLSNNDDSETRDAITQNYLRDRMGEARQFLGDSSTSLVRVALWIYDADEEVLRFEYSPQFTPTQATYRLGEGFIGQAFLEGRVFSEPDVRLVPSYKSTRDGDPPYRAVICVPIRIGDEAIGMLTIDKTEATPFSETAEEVSNGLAAQTGYALELRRQFTVEPEIGS